MPKRSQTKPIANLATAAVPLGRDTRPGGPPVFAEEAVEPVRRTADTDAVSVRNVVKRYGHGVGEVVALNRLDIDIKDGEVVALLGPSGCGKSTLLKMVGGLHKPTSGEIYLQGERVQGPSRHTGIMFQAPVLFPWLTVLDNVLLPIKVRHEPLSAYRHRAQELVEFVGLAGFERKYPWQLSGGMQQRAAMCRMLITDPGVLLLDEPFGALDAINREYLDVEVRAIITRTGSSAIFVTHSVPEAVLVGDRVIVLTSRPGRVAGEVPVAFAGERTAALLATPELLEYARRVRALLDQSHDAPDPP